MGDLKIMTMSSEELRRLVEKSLIAAGSVAALSREIGISRGAITNWADGVTPPRRAAIAKLKEFLNRNGEENE